MSTNEEYIAGLREMANFLEAHPTLINQYHTADIASFCSDATEFSAKCRELGSADKNPSGSFLTLERKFGPHTLSVDIEKSKTCEKVQTGTTMKKVVVPTVAIPVAQQEDALVYEIEEPVFEWVCTEGSWLNLGKDQEVSV